MKKDQDPSKEMIPPRFYCLFSVLLHAASPPDGSIKSKIRFFSWYVQWDFLSDFQAVWCPIGGKANQCATSFRFLCEKWVNGALMTMTKLFLNSPPERKRRDGLFFRDGKLMRKGLKKGLNCHQCQAVKTKKSEVWFLFLPIFLRGLFTAFYMPVL